MIRYRNDDHHVTPSRALNLDLFDQRISFSPSDTIKGWHEATMDRYQENNELVNKLKRGKVLSWKNMLGTTGINPIRTQLGSLAKKKETAMEWYNTDTKYY